jgi:2-iminobutanoate/2-iminopropanoate deaminase
MATYGAGAIVGGRPIPLSAAVDAGDILFLSGQLALRDGRIQGDVARQTELIFDSIAVILAEAGLNLDHVVKATIWLSDPTDFSAFNAVYSERLLSPYPARSCVISQLVLPDARVEIEVVASRSQARR